MTHCKKNKIIVVVGLPGSGKTMLGKQLTTSQGTLLDDISNNGGLDAIEEQIRQQTPLIVITDPHLCKQSAQESAKAFFKEHAHDYEIEWQYFENNVDACFENIQRRRQVDDTRRVVAMLRQSAKSYFIPAESRIIPVWQAV